MPEPLFQHLETDGDSEAEVNEPVGASHSRAVAEYLTDMITQLESMARGAGLELLTYLLSMARVEAETNARTLVDEPSRRP